MCVDPGVFDLRMTDGSFLQPPAANQTTRVFVEAAGGWRKLWSVIRQTKTPGSKLINLENLDGNGQDLA